MPNNTGPMTKDNMVERVARAISVPQHHTTWDLLSEVEKDLFYMQARAAIATMHGSDSGVTGSLTLDNASVQRLMDYGFLHYTDEGFYVGRWPGSNTPSRDANDMREALIDIRNRTLCPVGPSPSLDDIQEIASAALARIEAGTAATGNTDAVHEGAGPQDIAQNQSPTTQDNS